MKPQSARRLSILFYSLSIACIVLWIHLLCWGAGSALRSLLVPIGLFLSLAGRHLLLKSRRQGA